MCDNKQSTPVKSRRYRTEQCSPPTLLGGDDKLSSPGGVKWDFDLPPASTNVIDEAQKLKKEIDDEYCARKRLINRVSPYQSFKSIRLRSKEKPVSHMSSFTRSVNLLKEALGETPLTKEETGMDEKSTSLSSNPVIESSTSDLFDDSLNDYFNECSQQVEEKFYSKNSSSSLENGNYSQTPPEHQTLQSTNSDKNNADLLYDFSESDDHLFLELDLNNL